MLMKFSALEILHAHPAKSIGQVKQAIEVMPLSNALLGYLARQ